MDTRWKNTSKIIMLVISILIIGIYFAITGCLWKENMLTSAWKGTAYYKTPYHMQEIETAFQNVVQFEDATNTRIRESDPTQKDKKRKVNYSFYYSTNYKVLENRQDYQGENKKIEAAFSKLKEQDLQGEFIDDNDISDLTTRDTIMYTLATLPDVSAYMITKYNKTFASGTHIQKKFDGEKMDFGSIQKPNDASIIVAFQDSYLEKRDAIWQKIAMLFVILTGVTLLAAIAFLYSTIMLGVKNRACRWHWWDAKLLAAIGIGMIYMIQLSQKPSNTITSALLNGRRSTLLWQLFLSGLIGILIFGMFGIAVISTIGQWTQKTLYSDSVCKVLWSGLKKIRLFAGKAFGVLQKIGVLLMRCILGVNKYPEGIRRAQKRLTRLTALLTGLVTICYLIFISYVLKMYSYVPVGYSKYSIRRWYQGKKIFLGEFIRKPENVICVSVIVGILYLLLFLLYMYCDKKIYASFSLLEKEIKKLHEGDFNIDVMQAENTAVYGDFLLLSEVGAGFEETLKEKVKSERMKVALVTNVSHDLKTPLTSVISYIDLLKREEELPQKAKEYVEILDKKAGNLKRIVQDVFELAKTTSGEITVEKKKLCIDRLIVQTLSDMEDKIKRYGMDVRFLPKEQDVMICSDGNRLYRVMQNLIDNALKYALEGTRIYIREYVYHESNTTQNPVKMHSDTGYVTQEADSDKEEEKSVMISITNIAKYEIDFTAEEAMERFFRGDKSRQTEGSGLGLAIAKAFTEACGGTLTIDIDGDQFRVNLTFPCD